MLLAVVLSAAYPAASCAAAAAPGRVVLQPPRLAQLARQVQSMPATAQWDFAATTLEVLVEAYAEELATAATERPSDAARRAKLARWRQATSDLTGRLQQARARLDEGAEFAVFVDPQHQVFVIVDHMPIAITAPRPEAERAIERQVLASFCQTVECPGDEAADDAAASHEPPPGAWALNQRAAPAFEVGTVLRCEFTDLGQRHARAAACQRLATEIEGLATALRDAARRGYTVDWAALAATRRDAMLADQIYITAGGAYLDLPAGMLARVGPDDWRRLVAWLRDTSDRPQAPFTLRDGAHLLAPQTSAGALSDTID